MPDSPRPPIPRSPGPDSLRVLLVDDHDLFLEGLRNLLATKNIQVLGAANDGLEALEKARHLRPDVILMDVQMPRCDGLAATRLIKAELPEIKIVMLTMSEDDGDLFEAVKSGASGYLLKKLKPESFLLYSLTSRQVYCPSRQAWEPGCWQSSPAYQPRVPRPPWERLNRAGRKNNAYPLARCRS